MQTHFPSGEGSGDGAGLRLAPFRGVRYDLSRVGGLANVTSPPYDVIGPDTLDQLRAASPYNVVRLILPDNAPGGARAAAAGASTTASNADGATDGATEAAADSAADSAAASLLHAWLADGALAVDDAPALYVYEQRGPGWVQRGLVGLVGVGTDAVHPHENVMPGPVAGRRELMKATRSNLEPILLVYNGGAVPAVGAAGASALTDRVADGNEPDACAVTGDGVTHRLWAVTDPGTQRAIAADLAARTALIADGHHRYAAYRELREEMRASGAGAGPWDYGLAFLVDADAYPLRLGPIHRVLPHLGPGDAASLAGAAFTVTELPGDLGLALAALGTAGADGHAFLLAGKDGFRLLTDPDPRQLAAAMPPGTSDRWRALDAAVMRELLLGRLWSITDNERDVLVAHDAAEAVRMAADSGGTAVLCNPMPIAAVTELAAHGEMVPRKSTSFGPKPRTGLVLRLFDA